MKNLFSVLDGIYSPRALSRYRFILQYFTQLPLLPTVRIYDVGCNQGLLLESISHLGYTHVHGIDLDARAIARAHQAHRLYVHYGDVLTLPATACYDVVICSEVLEHVENDNLLAEKITTLVKPSGYLIITVPCNEQKWTLDDELAGHYRRYSVEALLRLFPESRFELIARRYFGFPMINFFQWIQETFYQKYMRALSDESAVPHLSKFKKWILSVFNTLEHIDVLFNTPLSDKVLLVLKKRQS